MRRLEMGQALIFYPLKFDFDGIRPVHAFEFNDVGIAPFSREPSAELEHEDVREDVVIEEAARSTGIVAAEFDLLPYFVAGVAMALYALDCSNCPEP